MASQVLQQLPADDVLHIWTTEFQFKWMNIRWIWDYFTSKNANIPAGTGVAFLLSFPLWQSVFLTGAFSEKITLSVHLVSAKTHLFSCSHFLICFFSWLLWSFVFTFFFQSYKHQCEGCMVGLTSRYQGSETPAILSGGYFPNISPVSWRYTYLFFLQVHCWQIFQTGHSLQILLF